MVNTHNSIIMKTMHCFLQQEKYNPLSKQTLPYQYNLNNANTASRKALALHTKFLLLPTTLTFLVEI